MANSNEYTAHLRPAFWPAAPGGRRSDVVK